MYVRTYTTLIKQGEQLSEVNLCEKYRKTLGYISHRLSSEIRVIITDFSHSNKYLHSIKLINKIILRIR